MQPLRIQRSAVTVDEFLSETERQRDIACLAQGFPHLTKLARSLAFCIIVKGYVGVWRDPDVLLRATEELAEAGMEPTHESVSAAMAAYRNVARLSRGHYEHPLSTSPWPGDKDGGA